ncbi:L,D-transpeptidase family protein [Egicoccus sp. AB-alg2]|uniref:L,D-transpeptidase family protein n=1 Tax=Egicoccus sp. AB-alg2 TaxID=3242693 RepID=UPI00359DF65D
MGLQVRGPDVAAAGSEVVSHMRVVLRPRRLWAVLLLTVLLVVTFVTPAGAATTLREGSRGPAVVQLQTRLQELRYDVGPVDGVFGASTKHAVVAFQKVNGLSRDGVVGTRTQAALKDPVRPKLRRDRAGTYVEVDLTRQVLYLAKDGRIVRIVDASSGKASTPTPTGQYRIERRIDGYRTGRLGTMWRPAYFYKGYAIHGYPSVPSYPASHGCVRVPNASMNRMWSRLPVGTPVHIYR